MLKPQNLKDYSEDDKIMIHKIAVLKRGSTSKVYMF
jgi:hypothetical protein